MPTYTQVSISGERNEEPNGGGLLAIVAEVGVDSFLFFIQIQTIFQLAIIIVNVNRTSATQKVMVALLLRLVGGVGVEEEADISIGEGDDDVSARLCDGVGVGTKRAGVGVVVTTLRDGSDVGAGLSRVGVDVATLRDGSDVGAGLSVVGVVVATLRDSSEVSVVTKKESLQLTSSFRKLATRSAVLLCCSVAKLPDSLVRLPDPPKKSADPELKVSAITKIEIWNMMYS